MNRITKTALLAAAGAAVVTSAQAQYNAGDLVVGFTSGGANDLVYDLGTFSSLVNGETWSLNSSITTTAGHANLSSLNWGVVGAQSTGLSGSLKTVYSTVPTGQASTPATIPAASGYNPIATSVNTIGQFITSGQAGIDAASDAASWNGETIAGGSSTFFNVYGSSTPNNPNSQTPAGFTSGSVVEDFYGVKSDGTAANLLGTFTFDSAGTLTFTAVPEPSTYGLLAGLGLLALTVRHQFSLFRKN